MSEASFNIRRDILMHEAQAIVHSLMQHSVCILAPERREDEIIPQGSGTCVRIGDHFFIATAAHVFRDLQHNEIYDDDLWIVHSQQPTLDRPAIIATGLEGGGNYDPVDVAWIELDHVTANGMNKTFLTLDRIRSRVDHAGDDLIALNGYPGSFTLESDDGTVFAQSMSFVGGTIPPKDWPESEFEDLHCIAEDYFLLAAFPPEGNYLVTGQHYQVPDPHGMSGGGLWQIPANPTKPEEVWSTKQARLVGINLEWKQDNPWVVANQMQHWLQLVAEDFPDITEEIEQHLASPTSD